MEVTVVSFARFVSFFLHTHNEGNDNPQDLLSHSLPTETKALFLKPLFHGRFHAVLNF
jgi:hypothetical protein